MNCPNCGAPFTIVSQRGHFRCDYCGTNQFPLQTNDGITPLHQTAKDNCPVCRSSLHSALVDTDQVSWCPRCRGFLSPTDTFAEIVQRRRSRHGAHERVTAPIDPQELRRVLHCPRCDVRMDTHPYYGGGNAVVDSCARCKLIWLDAGDLHVIERHVPDAPAPVTIINVSQTTTVRDDRGAALAGGLIIGGLLGAVLDGLDGL